MQLAKNAITASWQRLLRRAWPTSQVIGVRVLPLAYVTSTYARRPPIASKPSLCQILILGTVHFSTNRPSTSATPAKSTSHVRGKWTVEEDQRLKTGIELYGEGEWKRISSLVATRSAEQCSARWRRSLSPDIKKGKWTAEEHRLLERGIKLFGEGNWIEIAKIIPGRTVDQCWRRWNRTESPDIKKGPWTKEEDELLRRGVTLFGVGNWADIAAIVPGRTDNQCCNRWREYARPGIKKGKWTKEEDGLLRTGVAKHGIGKWRAISEDIPGRTSFQ
ncbi:Myb-like DNA-binding domain protein, partial [Quaeritorhiza haematococci]